MHVLSFGELKSHLCSKFVVVQGKISSFYSQLKLYCDYIISWGLLQYICWRIYTQFCCALFCCGYNNRIIGEFMRLIYPYPSGLLHWHWGNYIAPVPVKQPWRIWVKLLNTKSQPNTTKCRYNFWDVLYIQNDMIKKIRYHLWYKQ